MNNPDAFENLLANLHPAPLPQSLVAKAQRVAQIMAAQAPTAAHPADAMQAALIAHQMKMQPWLSPGSQSSTSERAQSMHPMFTPQSPLHVIGPVVEQSQVLPGQIVHGMLPMSSLPAMPGGLYAPDVAVPMLNAEGLIVFGIPPVTSARTPSTSYSLVRGWSFVDGPPLQFTDTPDSIDPLMFFELGGPKLQPPDGRNPCPQPCGCLLAYYVSGPFDTGCTPPKPYWVVDVIFEHCAERWFVCDAKWVGVKKSNNKIVVSEVPLVWIFEFEDGPVQIGDCEVAAVPGGAPATTVPALKLGAGFLIWAPGCDPYYQEQIARITKTWDFCPVNGKKPKQETQTIPEDGSFGPDSKTGADPGAISQPGKKVDGSGDHPGLTTPSGAEGGSTRNGQKVEKYTVTVETKTFMWCGPKKTFLGVYEETSDSVVTYDCGEPNKPKTQDGSSSRKTHTSAKDLNDPKNKNKKQGLDKKLGGAYPGSSMDNPGGGQAPK